MIPSSRSLPTRLYQLTKQPYPLFSPFLQVQVRHASAPTSSSLIKKPVPRSTKLIDELIPHPIITLVDPTTSSLLPPSSLKDILISLDRSRFSILLVDPSHSPPICRIQDKKADYQKAQAKKVTQKNAAAEGASTTAAPPTKNLAGPPKEVQLTWGVAPNDLVHKLKKAKELLGKGNRVTVVLSNKKGSSEKSDPKSRDEVIKGIRDALEGGEVGAKLRRPVENKGSQVLMEFGRAG